MENYSEAKKERERLIRLVIELSKTSDDAITYADQIVESMREVARLTDIMFASEPTDA